MLVPNRILDLLYQNFESAVTTIFKDLRKWISKELKDSVTITSQQIENISKEVEIIKQELNRNSGVASVLIEMKNSLKELKRQTVRRICKLEDRSVD